MSIDTGKGQENIPTCPLCGASPSDIKHRRTTDDWRCYECKRDFEEPRYRERRGGAEPGHTTAVDFDAVRQAMADGGGETDD